ncbi:HotDog domain-containing protein [Chaetomidium leptoderma]|uniref:HotDog domain-containing protein n=1 Tax=Chaetomidium leptoderma TaxID=669021 RepID=A0AAN6ZZ39_9PEZI|nr:HotDog domain-containing protein [Chaetomidium leptoderma]
MLRNIAASLASMRGSGRSAWLQSFFTPAAVERFDVPAAQQQSNFLQDFFRKHQPPEAAVAHYSSIDWTRKILDNEMYTPMPFFPRFFNGLTGENRFLATIVNTDATIPHVLALRLKDLQTPEPHTPSASELETETVAGPASDRPFEVLCLMRLNPGLASHASVVHGGFQAVIFDEVMRLVVLLHYNNICRLGPKRKQVTAGMTISYARPVLCPSDVLAKGRLVRREGRKWFMEAEIVDSTGAVLTRADSVWVTARS